MTLEAYAKDRGFEVRPCDGTFYRFERSGDLTGWWKGQVYTIGEKQIVVVHFGDWRTDEKYEWKSTEAEELSQEEAGLLASQLQAMQANERKARAEDQERVAEECDRVWTTQCVSLGESPYFVRKGLPRGLFGTRLRPLADGVFTVVALRDCSGKIWGLQYISPAGHKNFSAGARIRGNAHLIGDPAELSGGGVTYVAEGVATAASIYLATGRPVYCAFNAGNLRGVAESARKAHPTARIVVAGDDDRWTTRPDGKPWNPGRESAQKAAQQVGGSALFPSFKNLTDRPTDFNDLHALEGLEVVKAQLEAPMGAATPEGASAPADSAQQTGQQALRRGVRTASGDIEPIPLRTSKSGAPIPPTQQRVADHLLDYFNGQLVKQNRDIFRYERTHWKLLELADHDRLKMLIQRACSGLADVRMVDACYKLFVYHLPAVPHGLDMFTPVPNAANFSNGTLWAEKRGDRYELHFRDHKPQDFLVNVLPYEYKPPGELPSNTEFDSMLLRVFHGNPDAPAKIAAVRQMYGACLMPIRPHLFMLHGEPGTGKSTVLKIAARLVSKDNLCSVAPSDFHGFNMETMAGKLVNIDTDIPFNEPIHDEIVKKIEDRGLFRIRRKGVKDLLAPLPPVHLFGGNAVPKALDGASGAHTRRWTFIGFSSFVPQGQYDKDYWDYCFDQAPQGVLRFALEGLEDLLARRGHYLNPESGVEDMRQWQLRSDVVGQFVEGVKTGEVTDKNTKVLIGQEYQIERKSLWAAFQQWHQEEFNFAPKMGRTTFFNAMRRKKFNEKTLKGVRLFSGIGASQGEESDY